MLTISVKTKTDLYKWAENKAIFKNYTTMVMTYNGQHYTVQNSKNGYTIKEATEKSVSSIKLNKINIFNIFDSKRS